MSSNSSVAAKIVAVVARSAVEYNAAISHADKISLQNGVIGVPVVSCQNPLIESFCTLLGIEIEYCSSDSIFNIPYVNGNKRKYPSPDRLVICEPGPLEPVAKFFADATNRSVFTASGEDELASKMLSPEFSGVVVACQGSIFFEVATELLAGVREVRPRLGAFGIVAARSFEALTFLVFKIITYRIRSLEGAILIEEQNSFVSLPGKTTLNIISEDDALKMILSQYNSLVGFIAHGDNIDAGIAGSTLCGRQPQNVSNVVVKRADIHPERPHDACLVNGRCKRQVGRSTSLVYAGDIKARVLFVGSCSGAPFAESAFTSDLWLMFAALEGYAEAWIASAKLIRPVRGMPRIMHAALAAGFSLGEAVLLIEKIQHAVWRELPGFVIFGDPEAVISPTLNVQERTLYLDGLDSNSSIIRIDHENNGVGVIYCKNAPELHKRVLGRTLRLEIKSLEVYDVLCTIIPGKTLDVVEIWIFSFEDKPISFELNFVVIEDLLPDLAWIERGVEFLDRLIDVCCDSTANFRPTDGLKAMCEDLNVARRAARVVLNGFKRNWENFGPLLIAEGSHELPQLDMLREAAQIGEIALVRRWLSWDVPVAFYPFYNRHIKLLGIEIPGGPCDGCGMQTFSLKANDPIRTDIARYITYCPRCALISDESPDLLGCKIFAPRSIKIGESAQVQIQFAVKHLTNITWRAALRVENPGHWVNVNFAPNFQELKFNEIGTHSAFFTVNISPGSTSGTYYLQAVVAANFSFSILQTPIWVI